MNGSKRSPSQPCSAEAHQEWRGRADGYIDDWSVIVQRAGPAFAAPDRDAPRRGPGHDAVDAHLGHLGHGQLAAVALGYGLDHGDQRIGTGHGPPGLDGQLQAAAGLGGDHALGDQARAVTDVGALAGS